MPSVVTPQSPAAAASRATFGPMTPRKKTNPVLVITMSAIIGCLLIGGIRIAMTPKPVETVTVVAAANDIAPGCRLGFANLHYITVPKKYYSSTMFDSYEKLTGCYSRTFIPAREPFTKSAVITNAAGLSGELPKGFRAITLKLTDDALVDSQVRPGDRVDVVATTDYKTKKYTKTLCQNVLVMLSTPKDAVMSETFRTQDNTRVTLAVSPVDAEILSQASESSKVRLVMRSLGDLSKAVVAGADIRDVLPHEALREEPPIMQEKTELPPPPVSQATVSPPAPSLIESLPPIAQPPAKWLVQTFFGGRKEVLEIDTGR